MRAGGVEVGAHVVVPPHDLSGIFIARDHDLREIIRVQALPGLIEEFDLSFVLANGENAAAGSGMTPEIIESLFAAGVDCITTGDHVYRRKEIIPVLETDQRLLRPANFPKSASGKGVTVLIGRHGERVGVINLLGRIFMKPMANDPFAEPTHARCFTQFRDANICPSSAPLPLAITKWYLTAKAPVRPCPVDSWPLLGR